MDNQLKPCPACGASVKITGGDSWHNQKEFWIVCEACHCVRVGDTEKDECIKRWNALPRHHDISPDKVDCTSCQERLRKGNEQLALENPRLSVDGVNGEAYLLTCLDIIRRAVGMPVGSDWQQVAERVELLNKEADWFIEYIWNKDIFRCPMPEGYRCEHRLKNVCCLDSEETEIRGQCWREAARKAVQEQEATR